jgi:hypothetical protein
MKEELSTFEAYEIDVQVTTADERRKSEVLRVGRQQTCRRAAAYMPCSTKWPRMLDVSRSSRCDSRRDSDQQRCLTRN